MYAHQQGEVSATTSPVTRAVPLRTVFFGTPGFAVPTLVRLAADPRFAVTLVVTQPDRPAGRGRRLHASPVKNVAERLGLPVYQPTSLRDSEARRPLVELSPDLFVVAAYGLIFGAKTLAIPRLGCVNVHASLLPRYRGASPVAAAILNGDELTGVSLMVMEPGLDTGPVVASVVTPIRPDDTTASLTSRLADAGAELVSDALPKFAVGTLTPQPQPRTGASLTRLLVKADGWLIWDQPANTLERQVRAMWPWPRAWTMIGPEVVQVHAATVRQTDDGTPPGRLLGAGPDLVVACGRDALTLTIVQPTGGRPMPGSSFLAGRTLARGLQLRERGAQVAPPPLVTAVDEEATATAASSTLKGKYG